MKVYERFPLIFDRLDQIPTMHHKGYLSAEKTGRLFQDTVPRFFTHVLSFSRLYRVRSSWSTAQLPCQSYVRHQPNIKPGRKCV